MKRKQLIKILLVVTVFLLGGLTTVFAQETLATGGGYSVIFVPGQGISITPILFADDVSVGIGTSTPAARLHIRGDGLGVQRASIILESTFELGDTWAIISQDDAFKGTLIFNNVSTNTRTMTLTEDGYVGIGFGNGMVPNSRLEVTGGYFELDKSSGMPPASDCDSSSEVGRMKVDSSNTNLYLCTASGWVIK